jgi:hypothetical protein
MSIDSLILVKERLSERRSRATREPRTFGTKRGNEHREGFERAAALLPRPSFDKSELVTPGFRWLQHKPPAGGIANSISVVGFGDVLGDRETVLRSCLRLPEIPGATVLDEVCNEKVTWAGGDRSPVISLIENPDVSPRVFKPERTEHSLLDLLRRNASQLGDSCRVQHLLSEQAQAGSVVAHGHTQGELVDSHGIFEPLCRPFVPLRVMYIQPTWQEELRCKRVRRHLAEVSAGRVARETDLTI